jgi:hypothetical protein
VRILSSFRLGDLGDLGDLGERHFLSLLLRRNPGQKLSAFFPAMYAEDSRPP